jgi:hypothetical protein
MKGLVVAQKNLYAGLMFIAVALWFGVQSFSLGIGKPNQMGPGFFPILLSSLLGVIGIATIFTPADGERRIGTIPWKGLALILAGPILFTVLVDGVGFLLAVWIAVYVATHASARLGRRTALILATLFAVAAWLIFIKGLRLPLPAVGPWLGM